MTAGPNRNNGVTLVELLVVITVAAILAFFAVPDLADFVKNNRNSSDINDLLSSVSYARSEAVKRNSSVTICQSANGTSCQNSAGSWGGGWLVFEDINRDGSVTAGADTILRVSSGIGSGRSLGFSATRVIYRSSGLASEGTNATFTLCDDRGASHAKGLIIGASGHPRVARDSNDNDVVEGADGADVACGS